MMRVSGGKYGRIGRIFCSGCGFCLSREGYFGIEMVVFVWKWEGGCGHMRNPTANRHES